MLQLQSLETFVLQERPKDVKVWVCTACKEKIAKKLRPEGRLSRLTPEHLEKGRENKRKRNAEVYLSRQAYRDAESLAKKLRGD